MLKIDRWPTCFPILAFTMAKKLLAEFFQPSYLHEMRKLLLKFLVIWQPILNLY